MPSRGYRKWISAWNGFSLLLKKCTNTDIFIFLYLEWTQRFAADLGHEKPMFSQYRNQSIDLESKLIDWFSFDWNIGREWVKCRYSVGFRENIEQKNLHLPLLCTWWYVIRISLLRIEIENSLEGLFWINKLRKYGHIWVLEKWL